MLIEISAFLSHTVSALGSISGWLAITRNHTPLTPVIKITEADAFGLSLYLGDHLEREKYSFPIIHIAARTQIKHYDSCLQKKKRGR